MNEMMQQFEKLNAAHGGTAVIKDVTLNFTNKKFFLDFQERIRSDRHGEVAFAVQRKNGKFIVIRTNFYPKGVYRIPTGGITIGEDVTEALYLEISEEVWLEVKLVSFPGMVRYRITLGNESLTFYTFVFHLQELGGNILEDATEDEICEYIEADKNKLKEIADNLASNTSNWHDWCSFRMQSTAFIIPYLD